MASVGAEIYLYWNDFNANDIFGNNLLNRSSAAHGTDLVYLFGPTMYKNFFNSDFQSFSETRHSFKFEILISFETIYKEFPLHSETKLWTYSCFLKQNIYFRAYL